MTRSRPASAWSRRALVRSSIAEMFGVSSMYIGASDSAFMAGAIRAKSSSSRKPDRSRCESMLATLDSRRRTSCSLLISRLNTPTLLRSLTAACSAMLSAKLVLPTDGRAASTIEVALLEPGRQRVEVGEAGPDAADLAAVGVQVVEPVVRVVEQRLERAEAGVDALLADREQLRLGPVDRLAGPRPDPRSRCRRSGRRRAIRLRRTALRSTIRAYWATWTAVGVWFDRLDRYARPPIASSSSRRSSDLRDGDDVDRLAPLEQLEHRRVDPAVRLAVEVRRAQELRDLDDRVAVDQDGAEHRLLGLETLRRKAVDHAAADSWRTAIGALIVRSACPDSVNERGLSPT